MMEGDEHEELNERKEVIYRAILRYLNSKEKDEISETEIKNFLSEMQRVIREEEEKRERRREHAEWRRRIDEERRIDHAWHEIEGAFGERGRCRVCGTEISEHRDAGHRFIPRIQIDEEIVDGRRLKTIDYYLCISNGELQVKRITRPDKELLDKEYTVYEELHDFPSWLQAAMITSGRLKEFLGLVERSADGGGKERADALVRSLPEPLVARDERKAGEIGEILEEIGDLVDGMWDDSCAMKELMTAVEMSFGEEKYCRICGCEKNYHEGAEHVFEPKIRVDKDMVDERKLMSEDQYLCIHDNGFCVKRVVSGDVGGEHVYYEEDLPLWECEFTRALFEKGRIRDFLGSVRERLNEERRAYRQAAEHVEKLPKAEPRILRRFM